MQHQIRSRGGGWEGGCYCYRKQWQASWPSDCLFLGHHRYTCWQSNTAHFTHSLYTPFNAWAGGLFGCLFIFSGQRQQHLTTAGTEVSTRSKAVGVGGESSFASTKLSPLLPRWEIYELIGCRDTFGREHRGFSSSLDVNNR